MATNTLEKIFQYRLTNADSEIYLAPALTTVVIVALYKTNTDSTARTLRLHQVDGGGSSGVTNALYYNEPIAAERLHPRIDSGIVLEPGQSLRGLASANNAVTLTAFGITQVESA
jgi:hypothetical protein